MGGRGAAPRDRTRRALPTAFVMGFGFAISAAAAWGPAQQGRAIVALLAGGESGLTAAWAFRVALVPTAPDAIRPRSTRIV